MLKKVALGFMDTVFCLFLFFISFALDSGEIFSFITGLVKNPIFGPYFKIPSPPTFFPIAEMPIFPVTSRL